MARPDITLDVCTDGLSPRFTSLFPLGDRPSLSGGTAALEWITNGDLSHGDLITVRTNVAGLFGEPDLRSLSLSMVGDETWVNGVSNPWLADYANNEFLRGYSDGGGGKASGHTTAGVTLPLDADSPFFGIVAAAKTSVTRHPNITSAVKMHAFDGLNDTGSEPGAFFWPRVFDTAANARKPAAGRLCVATWTFYDFDNAGEVVRLRYSTISGTFNVGSNTVPTLSGTMLVGGIVGSGERISLVSGRGRTASGNVQLVDTVNKFIYVFIDSGESDWLKVQDWLGATITGVTSGATTTIPIYQLWTSSGNYSVGETVYTSNGNFYNSLINGNNNINPDLLTYPNSQWEINYTAIRDTGASKNGRILQHTNVGQIDTATVIAGTVGGIGINVFYGGTNDVTNAAPLYPSPYQWHRRTIWVDYRPDANGKIMCGQIIDNNAPQICLIDAHSVRSDIGPILSNWGIEAPIASGHTSISAELKTYTDNMMCIVSDSPTWAGVNYLDCEPLVMVGHRTSQQATFKLSRGVYSAISGKYLYILKDPMTPLNSSGMLLTGA